MDQQLKLLDLAVKEAEEAVIKAQSYNSPQALQVAIQKLQLASQQLQSMEESTQLDESVNQFIHRSKEQLRNLQENQNALL